MPAVFKHSFSKKGIALVMVLWVLAILMVIALSFSFAVRVETHSTLSFKDEAERKFLAEAGIERGIMEVFYRNTNKEQVIILEGMEVWKTDGTLYTIRLNNGFYKVRITDESGKVDINTAPDVILKNLLTNLGLELEEVDTIVDSIMDWKDPDDFHRLHGVESDYYMSLPNPYKAKNAEFGTLEELLMVKGVTSEILFGTKERKGLIDFLTIHSGTGGAININVAPKEVLMAIHGITSELADEIIKQRQIKEITYLPSQIQGITEENYLLIEPYIEMEGSNTFAIESVGYKDNKKAGYGIKTIVVFEGDKYEYLYYKKGIN